MKRILLSLAALCCLLVGKAIANDSTSFVTAILRKNTICAQDSSYMDRGSLIILTLDSNMSLCDRIGLVRGDTTFFRSGIDTNQVIFELDRFPLFCLDSLDSVLTVRYVAPTQRIDTLYQVALKRECSVIKPEPEYPEWMWWAIGSAGLFVLLISVGLFLFFYLRRKKQAPIKTSDESSEEQAGEDNNIHISESDNIAEPHVVPDKNNKDKEEIERLNNLIKQLKVNNEAEKKSAVEAATKKAEEEAEKNMNKAQKKWEETIAKKDKNIEELNSKLEKEKDKVKTIRDEVTQEKQQIINNLQDSLDQANKDLSMTNKSLSETKNQLQKTQNDLSNANSTIERLDESQKQYSAKITFAPYAEKYALLVKKVFELEAKITQELIVLSKKDLSDPYHMFKATHLFKERLSEIDMEKFMVEVEMAAKKQMTFTGNGIAHLSTLQGAEQAKQVRVYFVLNYLSKYIGALQIYVESLIGLQKLMEDVSSADILVFKNIRQQLIALYEQLEIKVVCPQLFDSIGNNMDLRVEQVDAGFESGDILEIKNCLVYLVDGQTPTDKIYVKAQQ